MRCSWLQINLKYGMVGNLRNQKDTCTACAGTMILEFAALSRLSGESVFEEKAHAAMDFLWAQRHRGSDLMGTVLNVGSGDWIRRDAGIGAGIDSYYEYCLKAYILLGDTTYLNRFNRHYDGIMKYVNQGPMFVDVHMHKPLVASRNFMDSLLAFWPGLQVLSGDIKPAIEIHEMLYQVIQKHRFLPEAFTHDFQVHWGQYPLRPEFVESTYFLYKATKDPHYLQIFINHLIPVAKAGYKVGKATMDAMNAHVRVPCGFAGVKDVRTLAHEDRMDSFLLAETFKYLYLLFADPTELAFDVESYVFTTEAHLLPLSIAASPPAPPVPVPGVPSPAPRPVLRFRRKKEEQSCPNTRMEFKGEMAAYARIVRARLKDLVASADKRNPPVCQRRPKKRERLKAEDFSASEPSHVAALGRMGIQLEAGADGRLQLVHTASTAESDEASQDGLVFMREMIALARQQEQEVPAAPRMVQMLSAPLLGWPVLPASPAQFGMELSGSRLGVHGSTVMAQPFRACSALVNAAEAAGRIVLIERSDCMFIHKARMAEAAGAVAVIVIDHLPDSSAETSPLFAMSGDGATTSVGIPAVFLFRKEGLRLVAELTRNPGTNVRIADAPLNPAELFRLYVGEPSVLEPESQCSVPNVPTDNQPRNAATITVFHTEEGLTCVRSGNELACFDEDQNAATVPKHLIEGGPKGPISPVPSKGKPSSGEGSSSPSPPSPPTAGPKSVPSTSREQGDCDGSGEGGPLHCQAHAPTLTSPDAEDREVVLEASAVRIEKRRSTGQRHVKFKFGSFLEGTPAGLEAIIASLQKETNLLDLEPHIQLTVRRMAQMAGGEHVPIGADDEAALGQLAYHLRLRGEEGEEGPNDELVSQLSDEEVELLADASPGPLSHHTLRNAAEAKAAVKEKTGSESGKESVSQRP